MIDGIILLVIGVSIVIGYRKGLVKTIYELISSILALVISFMLYPVMKTLLKISPIYDYLMEWNETKINSLGVVSGLQSQAERIREATAYLPQFITEALVKNNNPEVYTLLKVEEFTTYVATYIANLCITALAVVGTFIVVKIILLATGSALELVTKLPLIHKADQIGGMLAGGIKGLLFIELGLLIIPFFESSTFLGSVLIQIQESYLGNYLYQNNILLKIVGERLL